MVRDTTRDKGKSRPVIEIRGEFIPSEYNGLIRRWKGVTGISLEYQRFAFILCCKHQREVNWNLLVAPHVG